MLLFVLTLYTFSLTFIQICYEREGEAMRRFRVIRIMTMNLLFVFALSTAASSQISERRLYGTQGVNIKQDSYFTKPLHIIDTPTASILRGGDFRTGARMYEKGGVLASLSAGVSDRVMFGVSFGGLHIIGAEQKIEWNSVPGVHFVYRLLEESLKLPAMVVGFDSQGYGPEYTDYHEDPFFADDSSSWGDPGKYGKRYHFLSRGFFVTVSKTYSTFVTAGLHTGISYSLEKAHKTKPTPTIYMASDLHLTPDLAVLIEYDFAIHENSRYPGGILNMGARWSFGNNVFLDFDLQNVLGKNDEATTDVRRIIKLTYYGSIIQ